MQIVKEYVHDTYVFAPEVTNENDVDLVDYKTELCPKVIYI